MRYAVLLALVLSGCSSNSDGNPKLIKTVWERIKAIRADTPEPTGKASPTRAQIVELNVAMIQMNLDGEDIYPVMIPTHRNGPYVTYATQFRQSLTLRESQITATRGYGTDLVSASSSDNDPLKVLTPPDAWPESVEREYRFGGGGPEGRIERYTCRFARGGATQISLAGTAFDVIGFAEVCSGESGQIQNLYAADATTGRVWQSQQYIGSAMPAINLDILEPLLE